MKVLVTGASGLIGFEVCRQLIDRYASVHAVDNLSRGLDYPTCDRFYNLDLSNPASFNELDDDYDLIYHYAAINGTTYFYDRPNDVARINTLIDTNTFEFAKTLKTEPLIVYASSSEVVSGGSTESLSETDDIYVEDISNPRWSYRIAKIMGENYIRNSGLNYLVCRYFNIYSSLSKEGHFVADQVKKIRNGVFSIIGHNETRSFCHASDAVNATLYCADRYLNEVVNIGNDEEIKIGEAAKDIAEVLGLENDSINWEHLNGRHGSVTRRLPNIEKLRSLYPEYLPMSFKEGIYKSFGI
jgi:nucleoside-diphosphate-sugar epimerase